MSTKSVNKVCHLPVWNDFKMLFCRVGLKYDLHLYLCTEFFCICIEIYKKACIYI